MKKDLSKKIEIPEGVEVKISGSSFTVKGKSGETEREFNLGNVEVKHDKDSIVLWNKKSTKREKKFMNSIAAHLKNMILGSQNNFEYKLKICYSHFPFTVTLNGDEAQIKNFLGEKVPRIVKLPKGAEVNVDKEIIIISSPNKELAGRIAASFERKTKAKNRDKRVFQDGIYITEKAGKHI